MDGPPESTGFHAEQSDEEPAPKADFYSLIRPATNEDAPAIIALIDSVLGEWDDAVCLDGAEQDLLDVESAYWQQQGAFVVLEWRGQVIGSHAVLPLDSSPDQCTFKRLYLDPRFRGGTAGRDLMQWNIDWSRAQGFRKIEFWSDTRFHRAHCFFQKFGFVRSGETREMHDSHETYWEYHFSKSLE